MLRELGLAPWSTHGTCYIKPLYRTLFTSHLSLSRRKNARRPSPLRLRRHDLRGLLCLEQKRLLSLRLLSLSLRLRPHLAQQLRPRLYQHRRHRLDLRQRDQRGVRLHRRVVPVLGLVVPAGRVPAIRGRGGACVPVAAVWNNHHHIRPNSHSRLPPPQLLRRPLHRHLPRPHLLRNQQEPLWLRDRQDGWGPSARRTWSGRRSGRGDVGDGRRRTDRSLRAF